MARLTAQQRAIAAAFVATGSVTEAGRRAGYSSQPTASMALARPSVQEHVAKLQRARLGSELLPMAGDVLQRVMARGKDSDAVAAAKVVYAHASKLGLLDPEGAGGLSEASKDELMSMLEHYRARRRELEAKVVDVEPVEEPTGGVFG